MDKLRIVGGKKLQGSLEAGGSKNAALPILISSLLSEGRSKWERVPALSDITTTIGVLRHLGAVVEKISPHSVELSAPSTIHYEAPYDLVRKMRASVLVLGPLLARLGRARVSLPGGCAIGARPIDLHLKGLRALGAEIELESGYVNARAPKGRLIGARILLDFPSVGATENLLMAATLARGTTRLENCAREPEITDLVRSLRTMGAKISGDGSSTLEIIGVEALSGATHTVMGDRIEAGTFLIAGLITGGAVAVRGVLAEEMESTLQALERMGAVIERSSTAIVAHSPAKPLRGIEISTQPFPGFPTDMQAQLMVLLTQAQGHSLITETIFENRFMHVPELGRLGAEIQIRGNRALIEGPKCLKGAPLMATDLRASASLVLGALAAEGESVIHRVYHLDRGYEQMESKLRDLGAEVERIS